jgi:Flp pilus assembly protein TadD
MTQPIKSSRDAQNSPVDSSRVSDKWPRDGADDDNIQLGAPAESAASRAISARSWLIVAGLLAASLVAYWPVSHYGYVDYDDATYVTDNAHTVKGLSLANLKWAATAVVAAIWHPLTMLSHMADCQIYGISPGGHHLTSLFLHLANVVLLFGVLRRMTGSVGRSAFVAALFALHPLNVSSVAWISERKNVLSTLFLILTLWAYARHIRAPGWKTSLPMLALFAAGLLSKPMLVTLPVLMLLVDYWPLMRLSEGRSIVRLVLEKAPLYILAGIAAIVAILTQRASGAMEPSEHWGIGVRLANAAVATCAYLGQMVWPVRLAAYYPHPGSSLPTWEVAAAALFLAAVTFLAVRMARRAPYLLMGWLWYLISLLPVIGIIQVGDQAMADRYAYVPLIGIFIVLAWGAADFFKTLRVGNRWMTGLAVCIVAALTIAARTEVGYWRSDAALFGHAIESTGPNYIAEAAYGMAMLEQGDTAGALLHLNKAVAIKPDYSKAHGNLGVALAHQGRYEEAAEQHRMALKISPTALEYNNLGAALAGLGRNDEAIENYRQALRVQPGFTLAHFNLAIVLKSDGRYKEAMAEYAAVIKDRPNNSEAVKELGKLLFHHVELAEDLPKVLDKEHLYPYIQLFDSIGAKAASEGRRDEAIRAYRNALKLDASDEEARQGLTRLGVTP